VIAIIRSNNAIFCLEIPVFIRNLFTTISPLNRRGIFESNPHQFAGLTQILRA
jgi:hypothetical protein